MGQQRCTARPASAATRSRVRCRSPRAASASSALIVGHRCRGLCGGRRVERRQPRSVRHVGQRVRQRDRAELHRRRGAALLRRAGQVLLQERVRARGPGGARRATAVRARGADQGEGFRAAELRCCCRRFGYSSMMIVTGPSLTRATFMSAPNRRSPPGRRGPQFRDHGRHQRLGDRAGRRVVPGRPPALGGVRVEGELAHHQQRRADVRAGLLAVEDAQAPQLGRQLLRLLGGVVVGDADQDEQARLVDRSDDRPSTVTLAWVTRCATARMTAQPSRPGFAAFRSASRCGRLRIGG